MIVDCNAVLGSLPGWGQPATDDLLRVDAVAAGVDRMLAADAGAPAAELRLLHAQDGRSGLAGIRLYPTYVPRGLDDPRIGRALDRHAGGLVHVCLRLRDPRVQPQVTPTAAVLDGLRHAAAARPQARFVVSGAILAEIAGALDLFRLPNVWTETSHLQHPMSSLRRAVDLLGAERVVFGTNTPLFYPQAAVFRLRNAGLTERERMPIESENALRMLRIASH